MALADHGALRVETPAGGFTDDTPTAHQVVDGRQVPVDVSYALGEPEADGAPTDENHRLRRRARNFEWRLARAWE